MFNKQYVIMAILSACLLMFGSQAQAVVPNVPGEFCEYDLTPSDSDPLIASVSRARVEISGHFLEVKISDARPNTLYTVWVDFRNRARLALNPGDPRDALSDDYPLAKGALERGVAPAFATTAGVTAGIGLDPNGIITDLQGKAVLRTILDYELLKRGDSPVVGAELATQGLNRVGGYWLRKYPVDPAVAASLQITNDGLPRLERTTAQGITIVRHADLITHGHTPGVGDVDHFPAFKGDFPADCHRD